MSEPLDENLRRMHERFQKDHDRLRAELMGSLGQISPAQRSSRRRRRRLDFAQRIRAPRSLVKLAAVFLAAVLLVATGWASESVYTKITSLFKKTPVVAETIAKERFLLPNGQEIYYTESMKADPDSTLTKHEFKQQLKEMKKLISRREYQLVKTFERQGEMQYVYRFTIPDGDTLTMNFSLPLEEVRSWEEYLERREEQREQRSRDIQEAIAERRFRLINADVIKSHICMEAGTGEEIRVQQVTDRYGEKVALVSTYPPDRSGAKYKMSWEDHLKAIVQGTRKLIDIRVTKRYTYEITLPDGLTRIWHYGGGGPLK